MTHLVVLLTLVIATALAILALIQSRGMSPLAWAATLIGIVLCAVSLGVANL